MKLFLLGHPPFSIFEFVAFIVRLNRVFPLFVNIDVSMWLSQLEQSDTEVHQFEGSVLIPGASFSCRAM